jgi:hypothetical protein
MSNEKILVQAFSSKECLIEVANKFSAISDTLHLVLRGLSNQKEVTPQKAYSLITEEYGLRTRLAILKGDSENRLVSGVSESHDGFLNLLVETELLIKSIKNIDEEKLYTKHIFDRFDLEALITTVFRKGSYIAFIIGLTYIVKRIQMNYQNNFYQR